MNWIKFGILSIGYITVGLLPNAVEKSLQHVAIDIQEQTLSFLSNESLYGKAFERGYTVLLFTMAILLYTFFWLLTKYYNLGKHDRLMRTITYTFVSLALLAFVPHNIEPYSWYNLAPSLQRMLHNLLAVVVFFVCAHSHNNLSGFNCKKTAFYWHNRIMHFGAGNSDNGIFINYQRTKRRS